MEFPAATISTTPFLLIYNPENQQLSLFWQGNIAFKDLQNGYSRVLEIIKKEPVTRILLDLSHRKLESEKDPKALFAAVFAEALKLVNQPLFAALVVPAEEYFLSDEDARFEDMKHISNEYIITKLFPSQSTAQAWLDSVS
jgi:hypothetical protein